MLFIIFLTGAPQVGYGNRISRKGNCTYRTQHQDKAPLSPLCHRHRREGCSAIFPLTTATAVRTVHYFSLYLSQRPPLLSFWPLSPLSFWPSVASGKISRKGNCTYITQKSDKAPLSPLYLSQRREGCSVVFALTTSAAVRVVPPFSPLPPPPPCAPFAHFRTSHRYKKLDKAEILHTLSKFIALCKRFPLREILPLVRFTHSVRMTRKKHSVRMTKNNYAFRIPH